jgi:hypothetical protein
MQEKLGGVSIAGDSLSGEKYNPIMAAKRKAEELSQELTCNIPQVSSD